jgi:HTH-type transcriptional regulator / antitoxin HigA
MKSLTGSAIPAGEGATKFRMEQSGLSRKDLIPCLGSRSRVSEALSGKRELTLAMIRALNAHLGIPAESLIREPQAPLPKALADLDFSKFPLKDMEKNGAFSGFTLGTTRISEKAEEAIRWLVGRAGGFSAVPQFALRKNDGMRLNAKLDNYALLGWSLQVLREEAEHPASGHFNPEALTDKFIQTLVSLSVTDDGPRQAREYLNKAGIAFLALPHLAHTYLDGAIFMTAGKRPIIAMTLRYASDHSVRPAIVAGRIQHAKKDFRTFANLLGHNEVRKYYPLEGKGWSKAVPKDEINA